MLDSAAQLGAGATAHPITTLDGYHGWAESYDEPGNALVDIEQPIVRSILNGLPGGVALDAACGTGRHAAYLASLGHKVIGVDSSPEMLAKVQAKIPDGEFHQGDMRHLPMSDDHVDLVVCALALTHVPQLTPVLAEFARVLRPGGHLAISDSRGWLGFIAYPVVKTGPDGSAGYMANRIHPTSDYLAAALPLGFHVRRCEEPRRPEPYVDPDGVPRNASGPAPAHIPDAVPNVWSLHPLCVNATNAAYRDTPAAIVWHLKLADS